MTSIAESTNVLDMLLALCCECGTTRTVKRRAIGGHRHLRCDTCGTTTLHSAMMDDPSLDGREVANAARPIELSLDDKIDVLRAMGVRVRYVDELSSKNGTKAVASVWWYLSDGLFQVIVNGEQSDARVDRVMSRILERIAKPSEHEWFVLTPPVSDEITASVCYTP